MKPGEVRVVERKKVAGLENGPGRFLRFHDNAKMSNSIRGTRAWATQREAMLSEYLDANGTHDQSNIVLVAGIFGTQIRSSAPERRSRRMLLMIRRR
jgi:hypothetical protein